MCKPLTLTLLVASLFLSPVLGICQDGFNPTISLKAGGILPFVSGTDKKYDVIQQQAGFTGGVSVNLPLCRDWSLVPEVLVNNVPYKTDVDAKSDNITYLNIPVVLKREFTEMFAAYAGADFNIRMATSLPMDKVAVNEILRDRFWGLTAGGRVYIIDNLFADVRAAFPLKAWSKVHPQTRFNAVSVTLGVDL